jgi:hypothetical protein
MNAPFELSDLVRFAKAYQALDAATQATLDDFLAYNHDDLDASAIAQIRRFLIEQKKALRPLAIEREDLDARLWDCDSILAQAEAPQRTTEKGAR